MSLSNKNIFLIIMIVLVGLTAITIADIIISLDRSGTAFVAIKLDKEPEIYFVIEDPDPFFLKVIDNVNKTVLPGLFGDTNLDELIIFYNTGNVAYLGEFYSIGMLSVDAFSFEPYLLQFTFMGWIVLIIFGFKIFRKDKNRLWERE